MSLRERIFKYLLSHPINRIEKDPYGKAAERFGVSTEVVRCQWRKLRTKKLVDDKAKLFIQYKKSDVQDSTFKRKGNEAEISKTLSTEVRNEKQLAEECKIDLTKWSIKEWECKRYNAWIKNKAGEIESQPKYSVWVKLQQKKVENDLVLQKELILKELKDYAPKVAKIKYENNYKDCLLELSLFDLHLGKCANKGESEGNYDIKIAERRFKTAVKELLKRVDLKMVGRIFFPLGNDLLHYDNIKATTFNDTQMETDTRFHKLIKYARRMLVETIDELSLIAPVDVVVVVGNHDTTSMWMLGEVLSAYYHNNPNVSVNNSPKLRKYYKFGKNAFLLTHGDSEKHADLGLIFATEEPKIWSSSPYRYVQLGHTHKNKKTNYVSVDSFQGVQIQVLPSLSTQDRWHYQHGYANLKQAKSFLYDKNDGLIGEFTFTV